MAKKVCRFKRVLGMKDGDGVFERGTGVDTLIHTMKMLKK